MVCRALFSLKVCSHLVCWIALVQYANPITGGFRLKGIQYPLMGLRVVGTRIVDPVTTFLAPDRSARSVSFVSAPGPSADDYMHPLPSPSETGLDTPILAHAPSRFELPAWPTAPPTTSAPVDAPTPSQPAQNETKHVTF